MNKPNGKGEYPIQLVIRHNKVGVLKAMMKRTDLKLGAFKTGYCPLADACERDLAEIGPGLRISHGVGLVVGGYAVVGEDCLLLHGATLGSPSAARVREMPRLGDRVFVGAHAAVIGAITLGDDVKVGAGAVVTRDLPAGTRVRAPEAVAIE